MNQRRIDNDEGLTALSKEEKKQFGKEGYLIFPEFFSDDWNVEMTKALEHLQKIRPETKAIVPYPVFNHLLLNEAFLTIVRSLLGDTFFFHHANGRSLPPTDEGKVWHHDYDGTKNWMPGKPMMIHLLVYPQGINTDRGPLAIVPKSHLRPIDRSGPNKYELETMDDELIVSGSPGLLVVLNSALWHSRRLNRTPARRPYFNYSFCQFGAERPERSEYSHILNDLKQSLSCEQSELVNMLLDLDTIKREN